MILHPDTSSRRTTPAVHAPRRLALALSSALLSLGAQAQSAAPDALSPAPSRVLITGNPLAGEVAQPATVLTGDALTLRQAATLGETLDGLPGVAATWFGPNSNRPTIRGMDGDRVRLLDNAGASIDASNLSYDHAVALDPLVVERIEVLRGPASLLYGGNATGGVVNTLDNRIPRSALEGLGGRAELRGGGAAHERSASALLEGGGQGVNWHVDGFRRETDDLAVPRFNLVEDGEPGASTRHVRNSAADTWGGAVGTSWTGQRGWLGASLDTYRNDYGVTVEPDVTIQMRRDRLNLAGAQQWDGWWTSVDWQYGHSRYKHQEVEGTGAVGTTFRSTGDDLRVEARHQGLLGGAGSQGVLGLQAEGMDFSALGEEAFVPSTRTRQWALFGLEEAQAWGATWQLGLRVESVSVHSDGDDAQAEEARFGAARSRTFHPLSASLSGRWPLAPGWSLSGVLGSTQRAPAYYELFANGLHVATAAYERGNAELGLERSTHADLGLAWEDGSSRAQVQTYAMHFANYIGLEASGAQVDDGEGGTVPEYVFRGVRAQLWGLEAEATHRLDLGSGRWTLRAGADLTRGQDLEAHQPLPRIAPWRVTLGAQGDIGDWQLGLQWRHAGEQDRVPSSDLSTPGHSLLSASLAWRQRWGQAADALWFLKADNLTNQLAYSASAIQTVRQLSPLPGRSVTAGVRVRF